MRAFAVSFLSLAALPAAGDISLALPIDCTLGETCHIQQFVDHDPSPAVSDFRCGAQSYDGHKGTDFALPSIAAQVAGVDVLAVADGVVAGVRDEMPDELQTGVNAPDVTGRECGNGLVLRHQDGWETQYCHLELGSLSVAIGDPVETGQVLGRVGLSGQTEFPHLHLSVRQHGVVVDPFAPGDNRACDIAHTTLWADDIAAPAGGLINVAFSNRVPSYTAVKRGQAATNLIAQNEPIVLWGYIFGGLKEDILTFEISGPDGTIFEDTVSVDRTQAQSFKAAGRRAPQSGWPKGRYTGTMVHIRNGEVIDQKSGSVVVE